MQTSSNSFFPDLVSLQSSNVGEFVQSLQSTNNMDTIIDPQLAINQKSPAKYSLSSKKLKTFMSSNEDFDEKQFSYNPRKIFVGGLPHGLTECDFKKYFSQFGDIEDCVVMYDRNTGKPRGFGFITYTDERSIDLVMKNKLQHKLNGKWIECKRATPKTNGSVSNEITYDYETLKNINFYTYTPEIQSSDADVSALSVDPFLWKLSSENIPFQKIPDDNFNDCQPISSSTFACHSNPEPQRSHTKILNSTMTPSDYIGLEKFASTESSAFEWLSEHLVAKQPRYFTKLMETEDSKPVLEKIETLKYDEDKITTYDEIFENFNKSENGSDWNISFNDPFEIKDDGFPQPLPTSDIGSIFNKYGSGKIGECPPDKEQLPELLDKNDNEINIAIPTIIK